MKGDIWISFHITVHPEMDLEKAHTLADKAEESLHKNLDGVIQILVHVEPHERGEDSNRVSNKGRG